MENTEVMTTENEVMETAVEEIAKAGSSCGLKTVAGFGIGVLTGVLVSKFAKPVIAKIKNRKNKVVKTVEEADVKVTDDEESTEDTEE